MEMVIKMERKEIKSGKVKLISPTYLRFGRTGISMKNKKNMKNA